MGNNTTDFISFIQEKDREDQAFVNDDNLISCNTVVVMRVFPTRTKSTKMELIGKFQGEFLQCEYV